MPAPYFLSVALLGQTILSQITYKYTIILPIMVIEPTQRCILDICLRSGP